MLTLKVKNIGPIDFADIDLAKITAVIGPNSSGKTFLSLIVLTLADTFHSPPLFSPKKDVDKELKDIFNQNRGNISFKVRISQFTSLLEDQLGVSFFQYLTKNFGVSLDKIIKFDKKNSSEQSFVSVEDDKVKIVFFLTPQNNVKCEFNIKEDFEVQINQSEGPPDSGGFSTIQNNEIRLHMASNADATQRINLIRPFVQSLIIPEYFKQGTFKFIPTERGLIISIFNVLITWYISSYGAQILGSQIGLQSPPILTDRASVGRFIGDLLLESASRDPDLEYKIPLENTEIYFKIRKPFIIEIREREYSIPLGQLSSGISQLISIVYLFQKYPLIIEEPELNLHAEAQMDIANFLSSLDKTLFLTTHSDIFLVQLGINSKKKNREIKIYFLYEGKTKELKVLDNGDIEQIETISKALNKQIEELTS